ncbi:hypothetical protein N431DRAFT_471254 [Stipitochalara longipes BDJ]|nr:hypothetical protein N431DRAFT_471254 [Stipitochalara longipes BDJ]
MSNNNDAPSSVSEFTDIRREASSAAGSDFTMVGNPTPSNSNYEIASNAESWSEVTNKQANASTRVNTETSTIRSPTSGPIPIMGPSHALTIENMSLKEIDEVAGGSIKRYKEVIMENMKRRTGVAFTAEAAIPAPGEVIGDMKPGYEKMALGAKFWSWWTKKELAIFEAQVLKELRASDAERKQQT